MSKVLTVTKPLLQITNIRELLSSKAAHDQLAAVAAKTLDPETVMRVVANALRTNPQLQKCDPLSFLGAMMTAAQFGFIPQTFQGHAYLVPFYNGRRKVLECQLIIGYKGFIELAQRTGRVLSPHASVVREGDEFSFEYGTNQHLRHVPKMDSDGALQQAYFYAKVQGDGWTDETITVLGRSDVIKRRDNSPGWRKAIKDGKEAEHPWSLWEPEMWAKTAVRFAGNRGRLPMSIDFIRASEADERMLDYAAFALDPAEDAPLLEGHEDEPQAEPQVEEQPKTKVFRAPQSDPAKPEPKTRRRMTVDASGNNEHVTVNEEPKVNPTEVLNHKVMIVRNEFPHLKRAKDFEDFMEAYKEQLAEIAAADQGAYNDLLDELSDIQREIGFI